MAYILPREHLSYSQYQLWNSSKAGYRKRYYLNEKPFETRETLFGKATDLHLDTGGKINGVIEYSHPQHKIEVTYKGLPLLGYLDCFNMEDYKILERKTGHKSPKGRAPWDIAKVRKHKQLVFYSTLVKLKYGKVHPDVTLQWLETEFKDRFVDFDGHILVADKGDLVLTGRIETFTRRIRERERQEMLTDILRTALEIHNDYEEWTKTNT